MSDSLVFKSVRQLGGLVRDREVSPTELAEVFLDRLERLGSDYNAVVTVTRERALREARRAEQEISSGRYRGPLHGIPYGVKDLLATAGGIPTTWGAAPFRNQMFDYDATVVERLEAAGAVLAAKLAMVELAGGGGYWQPNASFTGPGITPLGQEPLERRIVHRVRRGDRGRPGAVCDRLGDGRFHHVALQQLRGGRSASHLWTGEPVRRHGPFLDPGQAGADVPHRR